jgi:hypothetical protein
LVILVLVGNILSHEAHTLRRPIEAAQMKKNADKDIDNFLVTETK